jgi:hypothetical protein
MQHFKVPTLLVVWPDDSPEHPHFVAIPLHNCKPDPLHWLANFADVSTPNYGPAGGPHGYWPEGTPPVEARVWIPQPEPAAQIPLPVA